MTDHNDETSPGGRRQLSPPEVEFADIVRHIFEERDGKLDERLKGIEGALKALANELLLFNQERRDEAAWRQRVDDELKDLKHRVGRLESE